MKNNYLIALFIFFGLSGNVQAQDGKETEVTLPDGSKQTEKTFKYPGGSQAFFEDIAEYFKMPKQAKKDNISGKVVLKITIDSVGVARGEILAGLRADVDQAALDMVRQLKKSQPASQGKRKVPMPLIIPLKI